MLFIFGLEQLSKEEKTALLAQINALDGLSVINDGVQKGLKKAKTVSFRLLEWAGERISSDLKGKIEELNQKLDWDAEILKNNIEKEYKMIQGLSEEALNRKFFEKLYNIAEVKQDADKEIVSNAISHRAAKCFKNIDPRYYLDAAALEEAVFRACVEEQVDMIKKQLSQMQASEEIELEKILRAEIAKLSAGEQEAIKKNLGIEDISAKAIITFLKTSSTAAITQLIISGLGIGSFLFLTTFMKALSLLLGVTFSFGVYTAVTSTLSFLLSGPFLLLVMTVTGGFVLRATSSKVKDQLAKMLIIIGRGKLMENT